LEDTHFTKNEKSKNEDVACEGNDCFLRHIGVIMIEWVPEGQMVNQKYYLEVLSKLQAQVKAQVRKKGQNCGEKIMD
jgi:tRNA A37 threonylcarbamoyladenosine biosynthesis protein TsaE